MTYTRDTRARVDPLESLRKQAANHWIVLDHEDGVLRASCTDTGNIREHCEATWRVPLTAGGRARRYRWLCPNECNLTEQAAVARLTAMDEGRTSFDPEVARRYIDFLLSQVRPKRTAWPLRLLDRVEAHEALADVLTNEWTAETEQAWRDYD